jgi:hypothetical protein
MRPDRAGSDHRLVVKVTPIPPPPPRTGGGGRGWGPISYSEKWSGLIFFLKRPRRSPPDPGTQADHRLEENVSPTGPVYGVQGRWALAPPGGQGEIISKMGAVGRCTARIPDPLGFSFPIVANLHT